MTARLRISILSLVTVIVLALCVLHVHGVLQRTFDDVGERAQTLADQISAAVIETVRRQRPASGDWKANLSQDPTLVRLLEKSLGRSSAVVDIRVLDQSGVVLAAADHSRIGFISEGGRSWNQWTGQSLFRRVVQLSSETQDLYVEAPIAAADSAKPVLNVRVLLSPALMRAGIEKELSGLLLFSAAALAISTLLAVIVSRLVSDSLAKLSHKIDRITEGDLKSASEDRFESPELVDIESKLWWLGRQYSGARSDILQLRSSVEQVLRQIDQAVLVFGGDGRLQFAGETAERVLARSRTELIGQSLDDVFPVWSGPGAVIQRAVSKRERLRNVPVTLERPNLPPARLHVSLESVDYGEGSGLGAVVALREADHRPVENAGTDAANRIAAISRITSGIAHEIKNPLNAMMLHLEIARERAGAPVPELEIVKNELVRLDRVVKSLLEFHKPVEVHMKECDLCGIADDVAALIKPQALANQVNVSASSSGAAPIMADCDLLKQAILNVAVNALEAMKGGGGLRFYVRCTELDCCLDVEDDGPGIPADLRDKIFNLYFTTKQAGTGVGLAMTYRIVQLHSGAIRVESEPGQGAKFTFQFPRLPKEIAA